MKFSKIAVVAVALVVAVVSFVQFSVAAPLLKVVPLSQRTTFAGQDTTNTSGGVRVYPGLGLNGWGADSLTFTIETGTASAATDTTAPADISNLAVMQSEAAGTNAFGWGRLTITGTANAATTDTIYAWPEFSQSPGGPWFGAGTSVPPINLIVGQGASAAPTTAGLAVYSAMLPIGASTTLTGSGNARDWRFVRFRLRGDTTSGAYLWSAQPTLTFMTDGLAK